MGGYLLQSTNKWVFLRCAHRDKQRMCSKNVLAMVSPSNERFRLHGGCMCVHIYIPSAHISPHKQTCMQADLGHLSTGSSLARVAGQQASGTHIPDSISQCWGCRPMSPGPAIPQVFMGQYPQQKPSTQYAKVKYQTCKKKFHLTPLNGMLRCAAPNLCQRAFLLQSYIPVHSDENEVPSHRWTSTYI